MKKLLSLILICALWLPSPALAVDFFSHDNGYESPTYHYYEEGRSVTDKPVTIHVDGIYLASDAMPFIENGRTLVPLRAAAESLGADVEWDGATSTALISKDTDVLLFTQDKLDYLMNNRILPLDVPLKNKNSRLFIPLRALGEALGVDVSWDADQNDVVITTGAEQGTIPVLPSTSPNDWQWLMNKYYVQPDPKDPYVGTWYCHIVETEYGETSIDDYLFISRLNDGRYHINNLNVRNGVDAGEMTLLEHPKNDLQKDTLLIASFGPTLYYNGPVTGFYTLGYGEYVLENDNLVKRKAFSKYLHEDIEVEELRHIYQRV